MVQPSHYFQFFGMRIDPVPDENPGLGALEIKPV